MSKKSILFAAAAAVAALGGGITAASAHGHGGHGGHGGPGHMGHHFGHHGFGPRIIVGTGYSDCGYLHDRWMFTGSHYWKKRFLSCKYGW
jgi:hypothetical protein